MIIIPFIFLLIPFVLEGIGVRIPRDFLVLFYMSIPLILTLLFSQHKALKAPPLLFFLILLFLCCINISSFFFSLDKQVSIQLFFFSCSMVLIFLFIYNHQEQSRSILPSFIAALSIGFIAFSQFLPFMPFMEKQVVFPTFPPHNHLGDFLGLLLVIFLIESQFKHKWLYIALFCIVFIFFITSFSRSAYLAFGFVFVLFLLLERKTIGKKYLMWGLVSLGILLVVFALSSSRLSRSTSSLPLLHSYVGQFLEVPPREMISQRNVFAQQALLSTQKHPFGIGMGNFILASLRYNQRNDISDSAHNIFLEQFTENGVPATILFIGICLLLVINALRYPSLPGYLFLYLLINFQTDYTYQIYLFSILFVMLGASFYTEKKEIHLPVACFVLPAFCLTFIASQILLSTLLVRQNRPFDALTLNPLNKQAYISALQQSSFDEGLITQALSIAPYDNGLILASIDQYIKAGKKDKALALYERAYDLNKQLNFEMVKRMYWLKKEVKGNNIANAFLKRVIFTYRQQYIPQEFREEVNAFCEKVGKKECKKAGWSI